ncbi:SMP-30/gluconolactonase/LRE family protein [Muricauda oceani]|uniref:SMP-30/gluconolactonase/LRE family protein n=1 Tax=Flagellimonas oceani TaxID=2698672 RepID=A0A6G7J181_9FLAO|nr:SMP-30/gluconolactonase/LRE family protein [Allomuricauda oceani]MBW8241380.1 SMP-30/gluconolactonase/LRE family protein [Allomuricauda oceani]QII44621.1 SMP-30/gluconolactonase/LRE family protein [Allomuricauda oceani]
MKKLTFLILSITIGCFAQKNTTGNLVALDDTFYNYIDKNAKVEVLAEGFIWSEGPVWVKEGEFLLFSDAPQNTIFKWKEREGLSEFLKPSGYTGILPYSREPGSNGLIINNDGELVACEHGDRRISRMPLSQGGKITVADTWQGKRFHSPNDIVQASNGTYYFTDPPYGLPEGENSETREIEAFGVYKIDTDGKVDMVVGNLNRPNGVALSPDEKNLYVNQSDPNAPYIMAYNVQEDGSLDEGRIFFDASELQKEGLKGSLDGLKVAQDGTIFSTGPSGVLVITPEGKLLGRIETGQRTANCTWGEDGSVLYMTAHNYLMRIQTKTKGSGF